MLTWEQCYSEPSGLQPDRELTDPYFCMLFNGEVYTYEQVSSELNIDIGTVWQLPSGLQPERELTDHYLCMVFNDEVHTYEW